MDYRLTLQVETARYLGRPEVAEVFLKRIGLLPARFRPTRFHDVLLNVHSLSFDNAASFVGTVPGPHPYAGIVSLYKIRHVASYLINWCKGTESWFRENPQQRFNGLVASFRDGKTIVESTRTLRTLQTFWLDLCQSVNAVYGYLHLSIDDGYSPRGEGRCLPRLRWQTYFGREYSAAFGLRDLPALDGAKLLAVGETGVLLQIEAPPEALVKQTDLEREIISALGDTYFWGYARDDWKNPQLHYDQPEIDWSDIICT